MDKGSNGIFGWIGDFLTAIWEFITGLFGNIFG